MGALPPEMPPFFGGGLRIPMYNAVPDIGFSANKLADVSDVSDGVHMYIPTVGAYLALKRLCFWRARPPAPYKGLPINPPSAVSGRAIHVDKDKAHPTASCGDIRHPGVYTRRREPVAFVVNHR